jgi:hypothetical protein
LNVDGLPTIGPLNPENVTLPENENAEPDCDTSNTWRPVTWAGAEAATTIAAHEARRMRVRI